MKFLRSSFLFVFFVFPLVVLSDYVPDDMVFLVWPYRYNNSGSFTVPSTADINVGRVSASSLPDVFFNASFGVQLSSAGALNYPKIDTTKYNLLTNSVKSQFFNLQAVDGSGFYSLVKVCPVVQSYGSIASRLYFMGYRGDGISNVFTNSNGYISFNCQPYRIFADVLNGTNTVWRNALLSSIASIQSSVVNIDSGVSTISSALIPSLSHIEEINSAISSDIVDIKQDVGSIESYSSEINETLHGTQSIIDNISSSVSSIPSYLHSNSNALDRLHDDNVLANLDVFLGDDTSSWVGFVNWAFDNFLITSSDRDLFIQELNDTDSSNNNRSRSYSIPLAHRRFLVKNKIKGRVVAANKMRGQLQMLYPSSDLNSSGSSWGLQALGDIGYQFTTGVRHELMNNNATIVDWREGLRQQLQDWKTSDEHGILNVRKDLEDNFTIKNPNLSNTNRLPFTSFVTNFVVVPITNVVEQASDQITSNLNEQAEQTRQLFNDTLLNPDYDGVNVRIKWPLRYYSTDAVNVHDDALDDLLSNLHSFYNTMSNLLMGAFEEFSNTFKSTNYVDLTEWLERWDDFRPAWDAASSNLWLYYSQYNSTFKDFSADNYKDFDFVSSNTIDRVASLGGFSGSYWDFQVATTLLQTDFFQLMFDFYNEVSDVLSQYNDPNTGQPFTPRSVLRSIADGLPSPTAIVSDVGSFTNSYNLTYVVAMSNFLASADSRFTSVVESTFRDHSLPGTIRLFTFNDQSFEIPVGPLSSAFGYLRTGLAFGYSVLLIILLPKYVLFWLRMYSKTFLLALSTSRFRRH